MEVPEASVSSRRSLLGSYTARTEAAMICSIDDFFTGIRQRTIFCLTIKERSG